MTRAPMVLGLALIALCVALSPAYSQTGFTEYALADTTLNSDPNTDFWIASAAPADVDADGDLDILVAGYYVVYNVSAEDRLVLYRNDGAGTGNTWVLTPFPVDATGLNFSGADIAWGDYDNDGDPDAVVAAQAEAALYRNDAGTLTRVPVSFPLYYEDNAFLTMDQRSLTWADYDNDGDLDLLIPSIFDFEIWDYAPAAVLRNDGAGIGGAWMFTDIGAALPTTENAMSAWADMEGDGDLDLLLANISPYGGNFMHTYRNDGGTMTLVNGTLAYIRYGTADWGDVDADGDLDIVYAGNIDLPDETGETVVRILFSDGAGGYTPVDVVHDLQSPEEPWLDFSAVTWADYDSDGDVDLLISGEWLGDEITGRSMVYNNDGAGTFTPTAAILPAPVAGNAGGAFTWFDVDNDGDLDYFVAGGYPVENGAGLIEARAQLFRNDATGNNAAPGAPANLIASPSGNTVTLHWSPASDDDTPATALTYELCIVPSGSLPIMERALPEPGNARANAWSFDGLADGTYRWSVRALDSAFNAGAAAQGTFTIGATTGIRGTPALQMSAPYPNPFSESSQFTLSTPRAERATIAVYDVRGSRVGVLHNGMLAKGENRFSLNALNLPSGVYFIRVNAAGHVLTRRITRVR